MTSTQRRKIEQYLELCSIEDRLNKRIDYLDELLHEKYLNEEDLEAQIEYSAHLVEIVQNDLATVAMRWYNDLPDDETQAHSDLIRRYARMFDDAHGPSDVQRLEEQAIKDGVVPSEIHQYRILQEEER